MSTKPERPAPTLHQPERRRTKRVPLVFHIQVSGLTQDGTLFRDLTTTNDVSEGGCQFELAREIGVKTPITIQVVHRNGAVPPASKPILFEVVRIEPTPHGWTIGAAILQSENVWHMTFPQNRLR